MENTNQNLKKRLYQNLAQRPLKHTFLLNSQIKNPKSIQGILKPKILQDTIGQLKHLSNSVVLNSPSLLKKNSSQDIKPKPKKVQVQKLSKQAKSILENEKNKIKTNLKPAQIFAFYHAFPEMIQDFFYLNRISHPYDYQIVSYAKRNYLEYMTISSQGVTLYHDKQAEFLTREEWLQDEKTYYQLQKIDFFNQYKLGKNFMIWKNKMKRHYMKSMQNILSQKLFLTSVYPRKCLLQVRKFSLQLQHSLILFPTQHAYTPCWKQLIDHTTKYITNTLLRKISEHQNYIIKSLQFAIDLQIKNFKENNKIKIDGLNSQQQNKEGYIYSQQAILRKQYKRVLKLLKFAESILLESKINLVKNWLEQIIQKLKLVDENNQRDQWFVLNFIARPPRLGSTQVIWDPTQQLFLQTFKKIIDKAIEQICKKHEKIMNHPLFQKYRNGDDQTVNKQDKHNSLKNLIENSQFFPQLISQIKFYLQNQFKHVKQQDSQLKKYIQIYKNHKDLPPIQQLVAESQVQQLICYVQDWKSDNQQMKNLSDKCIGMIKFDYSLIRKQMMGVAENSYMKLFSILPTHLSVCYQQTQQKLNQLYAPIKVAPLKQLPPDFNLVQYTKAVKRASDELSAINQKTIEIRKLQMLIAQNRSINMEINKGKIRKLQQAKQALEQSVTQAQTKQNQRLNQFNRNNQITVKKIMSSVKQYSEKLQLIQLNQKILTTDAILQKISTILNSIASLDKQAININNTQIQLNLNETNLNDSHKLYSRAQNLYILYKQNQQWLQFNTYLSSIHYSQLDCPKELQRWQQFNKQMLQIKQNIDYNQFISQFVRQIQQIQMIILVIKALQSKSLNSKSWKEISQYLTLEFNKFQFQENGNKEYNFQPFVNPNDQIYTVSWFKKNRIYQYKEKIQLIVKKSERQNHLKTVLNTLRNYINTLNLHFSNKKKEIILLADNSIVFQELSEHLTSLIQIFNHQYSDSIKDQTKILVRHYEYVIQILESYRQFGQNWEKYEELFDPSKHYSKQLSKQTKDFTNLEANWKKIYRNFMSDGWSKRIAQQTIGINPNRNTFKLISKANASWQQIKKGVQQFLDRKRNSFHSYFYFSDDQLLSLLTKSHTIKNINSFLPLIYENIKFIKFQRDIERDTDNPTAVVNSQGEQLKFSKIIYNKSAVQIQDVLKGCQEQWKKVIIANIKNAYSEFILSKTTRNKIVAQNITQVGLAFESLVWSKLAEQNYMCNMPVGNLKDWISVQNSQIKQFYELIKDFTTKLDQLKISNIILHSIYLRDKTQNFIQTETCSTESYEWKRTIKLCDDEKIFLKALDSTVFYGGQFLGPSNQIYIFPETQRTYLNLIQAIYDRDVGIINNKSSNLQVIKSFSHMAAQNFKKFSFCKGVSHKMMDRVLAGICLQGSWSYLSLPYDWEIISFLASHIALIQKSIKQNNCNTQTIISVQLSKYTIAINATNLPAFFFETTQKQNAYLQRINKINYRTISILTPKVSKILAMHLQEKQKGSQIAQIISQIVQNCQHLFKQNHYDQFQLNFSMQIANKLQAQVLQNNQMIRKKAIQIITKILVPKLKQQDKIIFKAYVQAINYQLEQKNKNKKLILSDIQQNKSKAPHTQSLIPEYGQVFTKDTNNLLSILKQSKHNGKIVAVVGPSLSGKTSLIQHARLCIQAQQQIKINLNKIYFEAYKDCNLLSINDKGLGIIPKCIQQNKQNWIILDGPTNRKYSNFFNKFQNQEVLSNYGVIKNSYKNQKLKIFLQTTNLANVSIDFVNYHTILYLQQNRKRVQEIIRTALSNFQYKTYEQCIRIQNKGDELIQIKSYRKNLKSSQTLKQLIQTIISQLIILIYKLAPKGLVKIKSIEVLYQMSATELAYKCTNLIKIIFMQNWDTITDKITKKSIQKFVIWVLLWNLASIVDSNDYQKLQKQVLQLIKLSLNQSLLKSIVFPGNGLQILSLNSQKVQSALSCIPTCGDLANLISKYNNLFQKQINVNRNKFLHEFYIDQPYRIRVITQQSAIFSYFAFLNRQSFMPMAIYGPPASGKKSILDIYNKKNEDSIESYSVRFKKHDPYYISKQLQKPFIKFFGFNRKAFKPIDISKKIHISIEDVYMGPYLEPATQFIRMVANTSSLFDEKQNLMEFRQLMLTLTINQINFYNLEGVDFKRLLSRLFIYQNSKISKQKLTSIFVPIVQNLCQHLFESQNTERVGQFINKNGENIIINCTLNVYSFIQDIVNKLPYDSILQRNKKLMIMPRIQQVCYVISKICSIMPTQQKKYQQIKFYADLWVHQILRVFGDKFDNNQHVDILFEEIKKYSLIQFKHSIISPREHIIFTDLVPKIIQGKVVYSYGVCDDLGEIQKKIQQIFKSQYVSLAAPLITDQFIQQVIKIYRVIKMHGGNLLIATPYKKNAKYLVKIASYLIQRSNYHDIQSGTIDFSLHIAPSILKQTNCCLILDVQNANQQLLYQTACLLNRNAYDFQISPETKQKINKKFQVIASKHQKQEVQNSQKTKTTAKISQRSSFLSHVIENMKLNQMQSKIQLQFMQSSLQCFMQYLHVVMCVEPHKISTTKFLNENMSIVKCMQVCWYEYKDQTLYTTGQRMLELYQVKQNDKSFINKCKSIYEILRDDQKSDVDFLKYLSVCFKNYEIVEKKINKQIFEYKQCIKILVQNLNRIKQQNGKSKQIQEYIQQLVRNQEGLSLKMKKNEENKPEEIQNLQNQLKKIKIEKDLMDVKSRQSRTLEKNCEDFHQLLPKKQQLQIKLKNSTQILNKCQSYSILVQSALLYLNNSTQNQYIQQFNKWAKLIAVDQQFVTIKQILLIFEKINGFECTKVPGWQRFSDFSQLKGLHFFFNFMQIPDSSFGFQPIVVCDQEQILIRLLSKIPNKSLFHDIKLATYINSLEEQHKNIQSQNQTNLNQKLIIQKVDKQILKLFIQQRSQNKNEKQDIQQQKTFRGIIVVGKNYQLQLSRNGIDILQKRLKQKQIALQNKIIIKGQISPNITFHPTSADLKQLLIEKSMQIQYGESLIAQNNKIQTILRQIQIKEQIIQQNLIQICVSKQKKQKIFLNAVKNQSQMQQIQKMKRKYSVNAQQRKTATDLFLIQWIMNMEVDKSIKFKQIIQVYQFLKKCLLQLNYTRQQKITNILEIQEIVLKNWSQIVKANLLNQKQISLQQILKFAMPLDGILNLILIKEQEDCQVMLDGIIKRSQNTVNYIDMQVNSLQSIGQNINSQNDNNQKILWIFKNFVAQNQPNISALIHFIQNIRNKTSHIVIVLTNNCMMLERNQLLKKKFKIITKNLQKIYRSLSLQISLIGNQQNKQFKDKKTLTFSNQLKISKRNVVQQAQQNNQQLQIIDEQEIARVRSSIKKFLTIYIGQKSQIDQAWSISNIPLKAISSRIINVKFSKEAITFLKDMIQNLQQNPSDTLMQDIILNYSKLQQTKLNQIQQIYSTYFHFLKSYQPKQLALQCQSNEEILLLPKVQQIQQMINQLPIVFNCQDFIQTNEPFSLWLISYANKINEKRFFYKKYLQECIKISKGNKLSYWLQSKSYGLWLPDQRQFVKLNSDYKIIKKALQNVGLMSSVEASSKQIKLNFLNNANIQSQSMMSIESQSINLKNIHGFNQKIILLSCLKASKILKLPLSKLKLSWRIVNSDTIIEQPVNGQNCLSLNSLTDNIELLSHLRQNQNQQDTVKLILFIYDPIQIPPPIQILPKQQKKYKQKKTKQQITKTINTQSELCNIQIPITLQNKKQIGFLNIAIKIQQINYKMTITQPKLKLF